MNLIKEIMQELTPCDGCIHKSKCADGRLACDAFALYVDNGCVNWVIPRLPTRRTYNQTMRIGQGESAIIRRIKKKLRQKEAA